MKGTGIHSKGHLKCFKRSDSSSMTGVMMSANVRTKLEEFGLFADAIWVWTDERSHMRTVHAQEATGTRYRIAPCSSCKQRCLPPYLRPYLIQNYGFIWPLVRLHFSQIESWNFPPRFASKKMCLGVCLLWINVLKTVPVGMFLVRLYAFYTGGKRCETEL